MLNTRLRAAANNDFEREVFKLMKNSAFENTIDNIVGNKPKGRISKRVFQENKACQIFQTPTNTTKTSQRFC